jgi:hypothetical protein
LRGETADAGERFRQANEIPFTHGDELATLIRGTGPRCLRRLAIGVAAGQRQREERGEVADSRGQVVALEGALRPRSLVLSSSFGHGSLVFLGLSEQGAHRCRGRADGQ